MATATIDVAEVKAEECELVDVRTPAEYRAVHAEGARNAPLAGLDPAAVWSQRSPGRKLVLVCKSGQRATEAARRFEAAGLTGVAVMTGGTDAWVKAGRPVVKGKATIPIERQVLIGAGAFVSMGVALSLLVHPGFIAIAGFVGLGLMVAGLTGFCGLALVLGYCPWNR